MNIEVFVLGTGGMMPLPGRGLTSVLLRREGDQRLDAALVRDEDLVLHVLREESERPAAVPLDGHIGRELPEGRDQRLEHASQLFL